MRPTIYIFLLAILLFINGCESPLSKGKVEGLALIEAKVEMLQSLSDKKENSVIVRLYDKNGKRIGNKDITVKVNNTALDFKVIQELYYTTAPEYMVSNIPVSEIYKFEITLTNGKTYVLGSVKPLAESKESDIVCNKKGSLDKEFVIYWNNLKDVNELLIKKDILLNTSTKTSKNYSSDSVVTKTIGSSGQYIVPRSVYKNSESIISSLSIRFNALKFGNVNPALVEGSEIKISGSFNKTVDFEE